MTPVSWLEVVTNSVSIATNRLSDSVEQKRAEASYAEMICVKHDDVKVINDASNSVGSKKCSNKTGRTQSRFTDLDDPREVDGDMLIDRFPFQKVNHIVELREFPFCQECLKTQAPLIL